MIWCGAEHCWWYMQEERAQLPWDRKCLVLSMKRGRAPRSDPAEELGLISLGLVQLQSSV